MLRRAVAAALLALLVLPACASSCARPAATSAGPPRPLVAPAVPGRSVADDSTPDAAVEMVLDALHHAAATADADTYFSLFAPNAVFIGTDATERWTLAEFEAFARPYFEGDEAWTYEPTERWIEVLPGGEVAVFDEMLAQEKYGTCRGTGTLRRVDGVWRIVRYHLSFPIPNEIAAAVTRWTADPGTGTRWVFVVRHAEKDGAGRDPELSAVGRARAARLALILADVPLAACLASEYRRTQDTIAPAAAAAGVEVETIPAHDGAALLARLDALPGGSTALVAGHSNTVPTVIAALGVEEPVTIGHDEYGTLYVVRRGPAGPELLRLGF